jgi:hypothetical protein
MDAPLYTFGCATRDDKLVRSVIAELRNNHPQILDRSEFVIIDNSTTTHVDGVQQPNRFALDLEKAVKGIKGIRYFRASGPSSSSLYRQKMFEQAQGKYVICFDPHVFFPPGSIDSLIRFYEENPETSDLIVGPIISGLSGAVTATHQRLYDNEPGETPKNASVYNGVVCRGNQLAVWAIDPRGMDPKNPPFEVMHQGMGAFSCRRDAWPGFHPSFLGFGGCETYIMEAFRVRGNKVLCLPGFRWDHSFYEPEERTFTPRLLDRVRNYLVGFKVLNRPELYEATVAHYSNQSGGKSTVQRAIEESERILSGKASAPAAAKPEPAKKPKAPPKPDPQFVAMLNRSGLGPEQDIPEPVFKELRRTPSESTTIEFGSGLSTLAFDANGCRHVCVERDAAKLEHLRPLLFNGATTELVHDPDGTWHNRVDQLFSRILIHDPALIPAGLDLGSLMSPGGTVMIIGPQDPARIELRKMLVSKVELQDYKLAANHERTEFFHVLRPPEAPLGEGPGTELKLQMDAEKFPACQNCITLARKMNEWGPDECRARLEKEIIPDIMPRAKSWVKEKRPYAKKWLDAASVFTFSLLSEDKVLAGQIRAKVLKAIETWEAKVAAAQGKAA